MPKVNSDDFVMIPKDLATLFPLSLFRCKSQSRDLIDLERGYWRVDLSSWPETEKLEFWARLKKAVEKGRFGWINVLFDVVSLLDELTAGIPRRCLERVLSWWSCETCLGIIICDVHEADKAWFKIHRLFRTSSHRRHKSFINPQ